MITDCSFVYFDEMEIYNSIYTQNNGKKSILEVFYKIDTPFIMESHSANWLADRQGECRKRKRKTKKSKVPDFLEKNSKIVQLIHQKFLTIFYEKLFSGSSQFPDVSNKEARNLVKDAPKFEFETTASSTFIEELLINDLKRTGDISFVTKVPTLYRNVHPECNLANASFLIPPNSSFLLGDVSAINCLMKKNGMNYFDFIIIDPPWQNRTVKRQRTYELLSTSSAAGSSFFSNKLSVDTIQHLPIPIILTPNGLLCLWVTNSQTVFQIAYNLLQHWGLKLIARWHWLKICKSGEPVCEFRTFHKLPFETFLLACRPEAIDEFKSIRDNFCIISVPNASPSRKPPVSILLEKLGHVKVQNGLELFGRYLLPKFTTIGHEAIKFQHIYYFSE